MKELQNPNPTAVEATPTTQLTEETLSDVMGGSAGFSPEMAFTPRESTRGCGWFSPISTGDLSRRCADCVFYRLAEEKMGPDGALCAPCEHKTRLYASYSRFRK